MNYARRIEKLRNTMQEEKLAACFYFSYENRRYLTGFTGSNGQVLVTPTKVIFFTDGRYSSQAETEISADEVVVYQQLSLAIKDVVASIDGTLSFESSGVTCSEWFQLAKKANLSDWVPMPAVCEDIRAAKDFDEIASIQRAIQIAENAYEAMSPRIAPGILEADFALQLEWQIRTSGSQCIPFEFIVASGKRSAMPHGIASSQPIAYGEPLTLDFGAEFQGYFSDMTFSGSVGVRNAWLEDIIGTLQTAQQSAVAVCKPGIPVAEVDAAARRIVEAAGYGSDFRHSLGHGVGLAIHEAPKLSALSKEILCEGMVVTIEPGIYVPGKGGARIEDMVLVAADGPKVLTTIPKNCTLWS